MKNFKPWRQLTKLLLLNFLAKFQTKKEISNEECNLCEAKISLDEIINSQTNNKSPGNYGLIAEFYKYFLNELAFFFFFLCEISFTNIHESQDCRGRRRAFH